MQFNSIQYAAFFLLFYFGCSLSIVFSFLYPSLFLEGKERTFCTYVEVSSALPCPALPCPALPCPALPCPALSCPVLSCPVLSCPVLSCPVLSCPVLFVMQKQKQTERVEKVILMKIITNFLSVDTEFQPY
jgi:hypothetical protein